MTNKSRLYYKFYCFNGKPYCIYVINGRKLGNEINLGIFDMDFNQLPYFRCDENKMGSAPAKPENFEEMVKIAENLSEVFPHVRVDLYDYRGKVIFGEMTFYHGSGYEKFSSYEFEKEMGKEFILTEKLLNSVKREY